MASTRGPAVLLALLALAGCSGQSSAGAYPSAAPPPPPPHPDQVSSRGAVRYEGDGITVTAAEPASPIVERQIIREGAAEVEVADPAAAAERVVAMIPEPGFVESSERGDEFVRLTMRIPATGFESFLDGLGDIGDVESQFVTGQDVTEQLVDWQARLDNLVALRDRLRLHLDRATNVQELVMVERELARVQSEIDSLTGRLQSVRGSVALSRVTVTLEEEEKLGPLGYVFVGIGKAITWLFVRD